MSAKSPSIIKQASSSSSLEILLKEVSEINKQKSTLVQLFDPDSVISKIHLLGAYANAQEAFKSKANISKSMAVEMLLFASMTRQIDRAIKTVGAKSARSFVIFANNKTAYSKIRPLLSHEVDFNRSKAKSASIAKRFGIKESRQLDLFVLQKIAVSRLD